MEMKAALKRNEKKARAPTYLRPFLILEIISPYLCLFQKTKL